jgi:ABC-type nitrate/sulfonate/bicarbonate transport system substrate-binding protein
MIRTIARTTLSLALLLATAFVVPRSAQAATPPATLIPLRVGAMPIDPSAEAFYALDLGYFKDAGLDVKLTVLNNGAALLAATASTNLDIGFGSPAPVIQAHQRGIPIRFFAPAAEYAGPQANSVLMVSGDAPIRSAADLNGKIVAVSGLRDLTYFSTKAWIEQNGGDPATISFVEIPYSEIGAALAQKRISAGCVIEPFISGMSNVRPLANLNAAVGSQYLLAGWFATNSWMQQNPAVAKRFMAVMQRTARWANTHHKESAAILAKYTRTPLAVAETMARSHYDDRPGVGPALLTPIIELLRKYAGMTALPAATDLIMAP